VRPEAEKSCTVIIQCFAVAQRIIQASVPPGERNKATKLNNRLGLKQNEPRLSRDLDWVYSSAWTHHKALSTAACFPISRLVHFLYPWHFASPLGAAPREASFHSFLLCASAFSEERLKSFCDIRCYAGFSIAPVHLVRRGQIITRRILPSPPI
jgi:hypothetical protein